MKRTASRLASPEGWRVHTAACSSVAPVWQRLGSDWTAASRLLPDFVRVSLPRWPKGAKQTSCSRHIWSQISGETMRPLTPTRRCACVVFSLGGVTPAIISMTRNVEFGPHGSFRVLRLNKCVCALKHEWSRATGIGISR